MENLKKKLNIDETFTKPIKKIVYDNVKKVTYIRKPTTISWQIYYIYLKQNIDKITYLL